MFGDPVDSGVMPSFRGLVLGFTVYFWFCSVLSCFPERVGLLCPSESLTCDRPDLV